MLVTLNAIFPIRTLNNPTAGSLEAHGREMVLDAASHKRTTLMTAKVIQQLGLTQAEMDEITVYV